MSEVDVTKMWDGDEDVNASALNVSALSEPGAKSHGAKSQIEMTKMAHEQQMSRSRKKKPIVTKKRKAEDGLQVD